MAESAYKLQGKKIKIVSSCTVNTLAFSRLLAKLGRTFLFSKLCQFNQKVLFKTESVKPVQIPLQSFSVMKV